MELILSWGARIIRELGRHDIFDNQKLIIVIRNWSETEIKEHCNSWSKQDHPIWVIRINIKLKCDYNHIYYLKSKNFSVEKLIIFVELGNLFLPPKK